MWMSTLINLLLLIFGLIVNGVYKDLVSQIKDANLLPFKINLNPKNAISETCLAKSTNLKNHRCRFELLWHTSMNQWETPCLYSTAAHKYPQRFYRIDLQCQLDIMPEFEKVYQKSKIFYR